MYKYFEVQKETTAKLNSSLWQLLSSDGLRGETPAEEPHVDLGGAVTTCPERIARKQMHKISVEIRRIPQRSAAAHPSQESRLHLTLNLRT